MDRYEQVPYGSRTFPEAHPDRLCTVARLLGAPAADPAAARVLEVGCGSGLHLVPIAARLPGTRCVGVDLSEGAIAEARRLARRVDAPATFLVGDAAALDAALADPSLPREYDYVVAHGLYSWVPEATADALLAGIARHLAPGGVAYVSYNTRPGWALRGMLGEMLRFHASGFDEPARQIRQARAFLEFLSEVVPQSDPYGGWIRREAELVERQSDEWLFHDLLSDHNHPVALHEFAARAARHGLCYLGDADLPSMLPERLPASVQEVLGTLAGDILRAEQYLDFVVCRNFRRTLLVKDLGPVDRALRGERLADLWIRGTLVSERVDDGLETFRTNLGDELSTSLPALRAAFGTLAAERPRPIAFRDVVDGVLRAAGGERATTEEVVARSLLRCFARGGCELYPRPIALTPVPTERPTADPVVRGLATELPAVPSLLHEWLTLGPLDPRLLPLLDGTRGLPELCAALAGDPEARPAEPGQREGPRADPTPIAERVVGYGRAGLLAG